MSQRNQNGMENGTKTMLAKIECLFLEFVKAFKTGILPIEISNGGNAICRVCQIEFSA